MARGIDYWDRRAAGRMESYERDAERDIDVTTRAIRQAQKEIERDIETLVDRFGRRFNLDPAEARAILNQPEDPRELDKLREAILRGGDNYMLARLDAPSFRYRISLLDALKQKAYVSVANATGIAHDRVTDGLVRTAKDDYLRTCFDTQRVEGYGRPVTPLGDVERSTPGRQYSPDRRLEELLNTKWSGKNYSERVWANGERIAQRVLDDLTMSLLSGKSHDAITKNIAGDFDIAVWQAARLVRTEYTYIANAAQLAAYRDMDMPEYRYVAILDMKTSEVCRFHDGKIYRVRDAVIGYNMPPLHPWCRSTTSAVRDRAHVKAMERMAVNPVTGAYERLPGDITYNEWLVKYVYPRAQAAGVRRMRDLRRAGTER